jgi:hypothetical protein
MAASRSSDKASSLCGSMFAMRMHVGLTPQFTGGAYVPWHLLGVGHCAIAHAATINHKP